MRLPRRHRRPSRLEALLREVDDLRLMLDVDLTLAAAAMDEQRTDVAADVLAHDRAELQQFAERAQRHLDHAAALDAGPLLPGASAAPAAEAVLIPVARRAGRARPVRRGLHVAGQTALVAAAAAALFVSVFQGPRASPTHDLSSAQLEASYAEFAHVAAHGEDPQRLVALGARINGSIAPMLASGTTDPATARRMLHILQVEQRMLLRVQPAGAGRLLAEARALAAQLTAALGPPAVLAPPETASTSTDSDAPSADRTPPAVDNGTEPSTTPSTARVEQPTTSPSTSSSPPEPQNGSSPSPQPSDPLQDPFGFGEMGLSGGR